MMGIDRYKEIRERMKAPGKTTEKPANSPAGADSWLTKIWKFLTGGMEIRIKPEFHFDGGWFHDNVAFRVEDSCPKIPNPIGLILHIGLPFSFKRWITIKVKLNENEWRAFFTIGFGID